VNDRAVQAAVIRALADAPYRASTAWRERGLADAGRLERFARFRARHFYYERVVHFFRYSAALARVTGRRPENVLHKPEFDALLATAVLGTRDTATAVAALVVAHLEGGASGTIPYHADLLRYEETMMVVEAGRRVWREPENGDGGPKQAASPELVPGTVVLELDYDLPAVLPELLGPWPGTPPTPPAAPHRPISVLVARSRHGRVTVARLDQAVTSILRLTDGVRTLEDLARAAGLGAAELQATLSDLTEIGALHFSTGS
jgi:hypothetical protein